MYINSDLYMSNIHKHTLSLFTLELPKYNNSKRTAINKNFVHSIWLYITKNYQHRCYPYLWVMSRAKTNAMYYFILFFSPNCKCQKMTAIGIREKKKHNWKKPKPGGTAPREARQPGQSLVCSHFQINPSLLHHVSVPSEQFLSRICSPLTESSIIK